MNLDLNSRLGLARWADIRINLPLRFVNATARFEDAQGRELKNYDSIHHRDETLAGVGDPSLQFGFRPLRLTGKQPWLLEFGGGLRFPLGRVEPNPYKAGREGRTHQHVMFGAGTLVPMGFLTFGYVASRFQLYANTRIRGPVTENQYGFQEGLNLLASLTAESGLGLKSWSFQFQVALLYQGVGLWDGAPDYDDNSGRTDLLLSAGVFWRPNRQWQVFLRASVPINLHLIGGELSNPIVMGLGLNYQFRLFS